jgi:internalin A
MARSSDSDVAYTEALRRIHEWRRSGETRLTLSRLGLAALPPEIGQLTALTELYLHDNQLTELPPEIGKLTVLTTLRLTGNQLKALPPEIGQLSALTTLALANNQLTKLPPEIGQLTALTALGLNDNHLTELPSEIGQLSALAELRLYNNQLTALPTQIGQLSALKELFLHNNHELGLPPEVLGPDYMDLAAFTGLPEPPRKIIEWYFRNRVAAVKRPILEAKVILVGWGAVGKTSIRRRLLEDTFQKNEQQTHKIEITPWSVNVGTDKVMLHVWDFGGQEIMHATHQFFLTKRSLYVLVLAGREKVQGAQDAEYWLRLIKSFAGDSPAIVVLNKQHAWPFDLNRGSLREKYPFISAFIQTDCEAGLRIDELKQLILSEVDKLPHLRSEFDTNWMAIKDAVSELKGKGQKRMSVDDYLALCRAKQEPDEQWQKWLLGFLHDLGVVVCFHEDPHLAGHGVLDPQWVVDGVYRVLTEPTLTGADGRVAYQRVRALLPRSEYTDADVGILLNLMVKFQLCFWLENRTDLVIPELMTEQEPAWRQTFPDPESGLRFELRYEFLPEGLLPRFIVATHHLSQPGERWRSGVILRNKEGNTALVRGDVAGPPPLVHILVTGPPAGRRRLLGIIRNTFDELHANIPGLQVSERVPVPGYNVEPLNYTDLLTAEAEGEREWPIVIGRKLVKLALTELLDGIAAKRALKVGGAQLREICDVLTEVFDLAALDQFLQFRFGIVRARRISNGALDTVAFELVQLAEREGWLADLIHQASEERPRSASLQRLCAEFRLS